LTTWSASTDLRCRTYDRRAGALLQQAAEGPDLHAVSAASAFILGSVADAGKAQT